MLQVRTQSARTLHDGLGQVAPEDQSPEPVLPVGRSATCPLGAGITRHYGSSTRAEPLRRMPSRWLPGGPSYSNHRNWTSRRWTGAWSMGHVRPRDAGIADDFQFKAGATRHAWLWSARGVVVPFPATSTNASNANCATIWWKQEGADTSCSSVRDRLSAQLVPEWHHEADELTGRA